MLGLPRRLRARRHREPPAPAPPVDPWKRAWTSPTKEQAQALFLREAEDRRRRRTRLYVVGGGIWLGADDPQ
ncbi:hypothetical protein [Streptomyces sp. NPDC058953]|uniref:hypothetical protein n=1 Tax=unclassified Streptomyces TaxID=2593676 RepID=UPI00368BB4A3